MRGGFLPRFRCWFLVLAATVCYLAAIGQWTRLSALPMGKHIIYQGIEEGLDGAACEQIMRDQEKDGTRCALWREKRGQKLENPALSRSTDATVWTVRGSAEVLFTDFIKLSAEDPDGCYIDRSAAAELFGNAAAEGAEVVWGERTLKVRGILDEGWPLVLVRPAPEDTADRIALPGADPESDPDEFLVRHALSGAAYDDSCFSGILKLMLLVFPACLLFGLLREFFPKLRGVRGVFSAAALFLVLAVVFVGIPLDMIPDRWSNFEFWTAWWQEYRQNIQNCLEYGNSGRDTLRLLLFARGAILALLPPILLSAVRREW